MNQQLIPINKLVSFSFWKIPYTVLCLLYGENKIQWFYFYSLKLSAVMYRKESNYKMYLFFLSCFLQFDGKDVTRLNETTVVFSSPPILEDPENYNITTIILMDRYNLVVKNESHSFAYVADPTFENFTDGIKKQVNKLINAKVNLSWGGGCSVCPWHFSFLSRTLNSCKIPYPKCLAESLTSAR